MLADGYDEALIGFGAQFTNASCAIYDTQSREASILRYADPTTGD